MANEFIPVSQVAEELCAAIKSLPEELQMPVLKGLAEGFFCSPLQQSEEADASA